MNEASPNRDRPTERYNNPNRAGESSREQAARLDGVSWTLLTSLLARQLASTRSDPIIDDPAATALIGALGLSHLHGDWSFRAVEVGTAVRTQILDAAVRSLVTAHPDTTVITLGAGLCTRCVRLNDLNTTWIDVDLPAVAALRRTLLPPGPGRTLIANSALSPGWRDTIARIAAGPLLFIFEGLTMYLHEPDVRALISDLADRFPGSDLLIETVGHRSAPPGRYQYLRDKRAAGIQFSWGVRRNDQLSHWHPRLRLENTWHSMDYHHADWPSLLRVIRHVPSVRAQSKIGHFHIEASAGA